MTKNTEIKITTLPEGKICDFIDQKIRNDTPEEYVRQNIERRLVLELDFNPEQVAVEFPIAMGSSSKHVDLVIFRNGDRHVQENAWIIVECKRDTVEPKNKNEGVDQLKSYLAACPNAEWGMWTNGRYKEVIRKLHEGRRTVWEEPNDIPSADGNTSEVDLPIVPWVRSLVASVRQNMSSESNWIRSVYLNRSSRCSSRQSYPLDFSEPCLHILAHGNCPASTTFHPAWLRVYLAIAPGV